MMDDRKHKFLCRIQDLDWEAEENQIIEKRNMERQSGGPVSSSTLHMSKSQKRKLKKRQKILEKRNSIVTVQPKPTDVQSIIFHNPDTLNLGPRTDGDRRISKRGLMGSNENDNEDDGNVLNMKKARFEIMKFGMSALSGTEKQDAESTLAISLGAKPPKSEYKNYKELQEDRKKEKYEKIKLAESQAKPKFIRQESKGTNNKKNAPTSAPKNPAIVKVRGPPKNPQSSKTKLVKPTKGFLKSRKPKSRK